MSKFSYLWNDLSPAERERLFPYTLDLQIRSLEQAKEKAIKAHRSFLDNINDQIQYMKKELEKTEVR